MDGTNKIGSALIAGNPGSSWHAIGTGNFNGDSKSDILFQNTDGQVAIWEMNGSNIIASPKIGNPGQDWHAIGTGAGGTDILLQNTSGQTQIWEMNGSTIAGGGLVNPNPGTSWHAIGLT